MNNEQLAGKIVDLLKKYGVLEATGINWWRKQFVNILDAHRDEMNEDDDRFSLVDYLISQQQWSEKTFGPGPRTGGIVEHIRKELSEIKAKPTDVMEWVDVIILALDGAWRSGHTPETIVKHLVKKQAINVSRSWPPAGPQDVANEHIRAEDAPKIETDEMTETRAREILGKFIFKDNLYLNYGDPYVDWCPGDSKVELDGGFTPEQLRAIAWWTEYMGETKGKDGNEKKIQA